MSGHVEISPRGAGDWELYTGQGGAWIKTRRFKTKDTDKNASLYNAACDGVESMVLALAAEGYDVTDPRFLEAISTAADAIANNYPDEDDSEDPSGENDEE